MTKADGHVEIELKGPAGKPNLVVRRNLKAGIKSSTYALNGKPASGKEISDQVAKLNVQVGNLCSFLPQDKVSEFAQMSPQQLLKETQRAAGNENLTKWHNILIGSGKDLRDLQVLIAADKTSLRTAEDRNAGLEREVERFRQRKGIEEKVSVSEMKFLVLVIES